MPSLQSPVPRLARTLRAAACLASLCVAGAVQGNGIRAPDAEELSVSVGSWLCERYLPAVGAQGALARGILDSVEPFALGYVAGVADATGRRVADNPETERRVVSLLTDGCRADAGRAIRDVTLLVGRAMVEANAAHETAEGTPPGPGRSACGPWLEARARGPVPRTDNWAEGYVNARFERAGRGLIPTARNRTRVLDQVAASCSASPSGTVREAARRAADQALAGAGTSR